MQVNIRKYRIYMIAVLILGSVFFFQNCANQNSSENILSSLENATVINQDPEADKIEAVEDVTNIMLMNRKMLISFFIDIMGPTAIGNLQVAKLNKKSIFGSPCSLYEDFKSARANFLRDSEADICANSNSSDYLGATIGPSGNSIDQAQINNLCVYATELTPAFNYILNQIKENPAVSIPANTDENILKLIALFYRWKPMPHQGLIDDMKSVVGNPSTLVGWKKAFMITCTSVHWQAL